MECDRPTDDIILRQGDIFAAHPNTPNWSDPTRRFGVVLSADCDLAQNKVGPNLVYAPIVGLPTYIACIWLPSQAAKLYEQGSKQLEDMIGEISRSKLDTKKILEQNPAEIKTLLSDLDGQNNLKVQQTVIDRVLQFRNLLLGISNILSNASVADLDRTLDQYFSHYESLRKPNFKNYSRRTTLYSALCSIGDRDRVDTWPICDLIGLDPEMRQEEQSGFIIDLRRFSVIPTSQVLVDRRAWMQNPDAYLRVCRLRGIYKSDLMQKFANLFVRIGLDDRRIDEHRHIFDLVAKKLVPENK